MARAYASSHEAALEGQRIGGLQVRVAILCALAQLFDGYDISAIGMAAPSLSHAWNVPPAAFATAFVMSNVGVMVGALASGPTGDRLGRKPVILTSLLFLGFFSFATAYADFDPDAGLPALHDRRRHWRADAVHRRIGLRLCTGPLARHGHHDRVRRQSVRRLPRRPAHRAAAADLRLAGDLPNRRRAAAAAVSGAAALAAGVTALPAGARQSHAGSTARSIAATGIDPDAASGVQHVDVARGSPVAALFSDGYALRTILFWIMFFASLLSLYLIGFWLPTVLHLEGLSPADVGVRVQPLRRGRRAQRAGARTVGHQLRPGARAHDLPGMRRRGHRRGRAGPSALPGAAGCDLRHGRLCRRRPVGSERTVRREIPGAHAHHRRGLGVGHRTARRHLRPRAGRLPARPGLAGATYSAVRLRDRRHRRALRRAAATAGRHRSPSNLCQNAPEVTRRVMSPLSPRSFSAAPLPSPFSAW